MRRIALTCCLLLACSGGDDGDGNWDCSTEKNLSEQCDEGEVIWCHAGGTPHFHGGAKCALANLTCTEVTEDRAVCTDPTLTCTAGEYSCDGNTAVNCVEGVVALEPCGTRKTCLEEPAAGLATCWDDRPEAPCSGHGALYENGCVCDRGYTLGSNAETCTAG